MGVFDDKKFEELDWMSVAMEPIDSELNTVLEAIPEEIQIDFNAYLALCRDGYGMNLDTSKVVSYYARRHTKKELSWKQLNALIPCFELTMEGSDIELNFETRKITGGTIRLVKVQSTMDEKTLAGLLGQEGIEKVGSARIHTSAMGRANEIMDLLGKCDDGLKSRSEHKKRRTLQLRLKVLFKDNEWKIKDTELANKVGLWIYDYIQDGNLSALSNFCRLKVMTHKGDPIYSMEEVK